MSSDDTELQPLNVDEEDCEVRSSSQQRRKRFKYKTSTYSEPFKDAGTFAWKQLNDFIWVPLRRSRATFTSRAGRSWPGLNTRPFRRTERWGPRGCVKITGALGGFALVFLVLFALLSPSYTHPPRHYQELRRQARDVGKAGRINLQEQKIFLAASIYDPKGHIVSGAWGQSVVQLIDLLGPNNTFLSIYESDSGSAGALALQRFEERIECDHKLVSEEKIDWTDPARITLPDGEPAIKRIAYLAEARNRALSPLDTPSVVEFDKILFLNDVIFDPVEAAQLLFSTNVQEDGRTKYRAACAVDFVLPFKFYDTYATRDLEGFSAGLPIFPWFSSAGLGQSRQDVLQQKDAVRVKSCWGGMVAFDAQFFQNRADPPSQIDTAVPSPVRFRAEPDLYWDSSECCLIHADLQARASSGYDPDSDAEIYMNPYIRTAYTERTFRYLGLARRFEKLLAPFQNLINKAVGLPFSNERRLTKPGEPIPQTVWVQDSSTATGRWENQTLPANAGGFCAVNILMVHRLHSIEGEKNWEKLPLPPLPLTASD